MFIRGSPSFPVGLQNAEGSSRPQYLPACPCIDKAAKTRNLKFSLTRLSLGELALLATGVQGQRRVAFAGEGADRIGASPEFAHARILALINIWNHKEPFKATQFIYSLDFALWFSPLAKGSKQESQREHVQHNPPYPRVQYLLIPLTQSRNIKKKS